MKIRFCANNSGAEAFCNELRGQYPQLNIKLKDCRKQCKACRKGPLALVDKQPLSAATWPLMLQALQERIKNSVI